MMANPRIIITKNIITIIMEFNSLDNRDINLLDYTAVHVPVTAVDSSQSRLLILE